MTFKLNFSNIAILYFWRNRNLNYVFFCSKFFKYGTVIISNTLISTYFIIYIQWWIKMNLHPRQQDASSSRTDRFYWGGMSLTAKSRLVLWKITRPCCAWKTSSLWGVFSRPVWPNLSLFVGWALLRQIFQHKTPHDYPHLRFDPILPKKKNTFFVRVGCCLGDKIVNF